MILVGSKLKVSDNSGALKVKCIKILGSSQCNHTHLGDRLVVSVKQAKYKKKVSVHAVCYCILIRQKSKTYRKNGAYLFFEENSVVLLKKNKKDPIGNRLKGVVTQELRYKKCLKIMLLAWNII
jgi:large subunit ribosomal protein L14